MSNPTMFGLDREPEEVTGFDLARRGQVIHVLFDTDGGIREVIFPPEILIRFVEELQK